MADRPEQSPHPPGARWDHVAPRRKFLSAAVSAVFRVDSARVELRGREGSLCRCPSGVTHRQPTTPRSSSFPRNAESASPLFEGGRIEVRGPSTHVRRGTNHHPPLSLAKGETTKCLSAFVRGNCAVERTGPFVKIFARKPPRPFRNSCAPGANARSIQ